MASNENFRTKGELVKLMRWFSIVAAAGQWQGDFFATRMILEQSAEKGVAQTDDADKAQVDDETPLETAEGDDRAHLGALKKTQSYVGFGPKPHHWLLDC